jgi:hypothetical protein
VPRIGHQHAGFDLLRGIACVPIHGLFCSNRHNRRNQCESAGDGKNFVVARGNHGDGIYHGIVADQKPGDQQYAGEDNRGGGLESFMSVGVVVVGRSVAEFDADNYNNGADNIG